MNGREKTMKNVTKVIEIAGERNAKPAANGQPVVVPTTTIVAMAADDSEVMRRQIDGSHPQTRANTRERKAIADVIYGHTPHPSTY